MYHFIVNLRSRAGRAKKTWQTVQAELELRKVEYKGYVSKYPGHATKLADMICNEYDGVKKIVVVGGDGTVNEVINGLHPYSEVLLGYIPIGAGNDLAKGLRISGDPIVALEHVLSPTRYQYVDHGILNFYDGTAPRRFAVSSGIGFDAEICERVRSSSSRVLLNRLGIGQLAYFVEGVKQIFKSKPVDMEMLIDGTRKRRMKKVVFTAAMIQKTEGGGLKMAPTADNSDGKLTICLVHEISKPRVVLLILLLLLGKHTHARGIEIFNCNTLEITAKESLSIHTDGELPGKQPHIRFACLPEQIRMFI